VRRQRDQAHAAARLGPGGQVCQETADHDVFQRTHGDKRFHHPVVGDLSSTYEARTPADDLEQTLGVSTAEPGTLPRNASNCWPDGTRPCGSRLAPQALSWPTHAAPLSERVIRVGQTSGSVP